MSWYDRTRTQQKWLGESPAFGCPWRNDMDSISSEDTFLETHFDAVLVFLSVPGRKGRKPWSWFFVNFKNPNRSELCFSLQAVWRTRVIQLWWTQRNPTWYLSDVFKSSSISYLHDAVSNCRSWLRVLVPFPHWQRHRIFHESGVGNGTLWCWCRVGWA